MEYRSERDPRYYLVPSHPVDEECQRDEVTCTISKSQNSNPSTQTLNVAFFPLHQNGTMKGLLGLDLNPGPCVTLVKLLNSFGPQFLIC